LYSFYNNGTKKKKSNEKWKKRMKNFVKINSFKENLQQLKEIKLI